MSQPIGALLYVRELDGVGATLEIESCEETTIKTLVSLVSKLIDAGADVNASVSFNRSSYDTKIGKWMRWVERRTPLETAKLYFNVGDLSGLSFGVPIASTQSLVDVLLAKGARKSTVAVQEESQRGV